eukprot:6868262-Ditylum_brightwellii.AAC.1
MLSSGMINGPLIFAVGTKDHAGCACWLLCAPSELPASSPPLELSASSPPLEMAAVVSCSLGPYFLGL